MAFSLHTIESTKWTRQARAVQIINMHAPTFHDFRCHHRGMTERMSPNPENTVNAASKAIISSKPLVIQPGKGGEGRKEEERRIIRHTV